jgi:hypothetical protein
MRMDPRTSSLEKASFTRSLRLPPSSRDFGLGLRLREPFFSPPSDDAVVESFEDRAVGRLLEGKPSEFKLCRSNFGFAVQHAAV